MKTNKCLVIDPMHESIFPLLREIEWEVDYQPEITRERIKDIHHLYQGLIVRGKTRIDRDLLGTQTTIKFVGRAGAGLDVLDLEFLAEKGIHVLHASEGNRDAVGEYTLGALLSLMRNIPKADQEVKTFTWDREGNRGEEIMGKTIGIIGYGNMGQAFARRLTGFQCNVLGYDKYKTGFSDAFCQEASMERLFEEADIVSLHIPLTTETRAMVDKSYVASFKKKTIFVNTARGEIISLTDFVGCMETGRIRGAVLDVLENEKLLTLTAVQLQAFNHLRNRSDVILTPHIAGWTFESHRKINVALVQKIKALQLA